MCYWAVPYNILTHIINLNSMDWVAIIGGFVIAYLLLQIYRAIKEARAPPPAPSKWMVGDITQHTLQFHNGMDYSKPTLIAVQGILYDVTNATELYGPRGSHAAYAGKEVARALAKDSLDSSDLGSAELSGCSEAELQRLEQQLAHIKATYDEVGKLVPMRDFTLQELAQHDGSNPDTPMLISIRGVVFDVSTGKQFYGPNGIYPFAGHEVARAFALTSTELSDCTDNLEGLGAMEMDNLQEWEAKFNWKYPVVGRLVQQQQKAA